MTRRALAAAAFALLLPLALAAQQAGGREPQSGAAAAEHPMAPVLAHEDVPPVAAVRTSANLTVDGRLDEPAWQTATPVTQFFQLDPEEGAPATERTEVRILYDDEAIYVGAWLWSAPERMWYRFVRRDVPQTDSEIFGVHFDSYHDHRTSYRFSTNPAGSKRDLILIGNGGGIGGLTGGDATWNPVWDVKTTRGDGIWYAEMRIPFSQLRFRREDVQTWGILIERRLRPAEEMVSHVFIPKGQPGGVPRFGHLVGIEGIRPGRKLELLPYAGGRAEYVAVPRSTNVPFANPFRSSTEYFGYGGLDVKYRITSNLILDATVNPDFGQVEVDPAVINLTAFETRFQEQRPFFIEGADNFEFGEPGGAEVLYSRRIGRSPHGSVPSEAAYDLSPSWTTILGAAKLSGKTASGWSLGLLDAVTGHESASWIGVDQQRRELEVEPLTNYFAGRVRRELRAGQTTTGLLLTAVNRDLGGSPLEGALHRSAFSGGADLSHEFARRAWRLDVQVAGSRVAGEPGALVATQRSSARYYHRPDADYVAVDSSATSLSGYAFRAVLNKQSGLWRFGAGTSGVSPGYEVNDIGFQTIADRVLTEAAIGYEQPRPTRYFRDWGARLGLGTAWNYGGDRVATDVSATANGELHQLITLRGAFNWQPERLNPRLTRGGPLMRDPSGWATSFNISNDIRAKRTVRLGADVSGDDSGAWQRRANLNLGFKGSSLFDVTLGPSVTTSFATAQYVTAVTDATATRTFGRRYVFADLRQTTLSLDTRLNMAFNAETSVELFAQPFLSSGDYRNLKELATPRSFDFVRYGIDGGTQTSITGGRFEIDPDGVGSARAFRVDDKDFNFRSLRANAVFRWEWRPGSTLYLVWQQIRSGTDAALGAPIGSGRVGAFEFGRDARELFDLHGDNVLLVKASYWFNP